MPLIDRVDSLLIVIDAQPGFAGPTDATSREAGIEVRHAKGVYYEWVRTLAAARALENDHPDLANPPGFDL
jgi:hypothetical protein